MNIRSPLARARGLGSANAGVVHWWRQRLTAAALVPLSFWFVTSLVMRTGGGFDATRQWLASPLTAVPLALFIGVVFYHSQLGLQVIVEDYIHHEGTKLAVLVGLQFANALLAASAIFAVLSISLGAG